MRWSLTPVASVSRRFAFVVSARAVLVYTVARSIDRSGMNPGVAVVAVAATHGEGIAVLVDVAEITGQAQHLAFDGGVFERDTLDLLAARGESRQSHDYGQNQRDHGQRTETGTGGQPDAP